MKASVRKNTTRKVLALLKPYRKQVVLSALLAAVLTAGSLYLPLIAGSAIDLITAPGKVRADLLLPLLLRAAAVAAAAALARWIMTCVSNDIAYSAVRDLRVRVFRKIQKLPLSYLDSKPDGEIVSRVISDADRFSEGLLLGFSQLFTGALAIAGTMVFMLCVNWKIALVIIAVSPVSLVVSRLIARRTYRAFSEQSAVRGEQLSAADELIECQKLVRAFSREEESREKFSGANSRLARRSLSAVFLSSLTNPSIRFVNGLIYAAVAFLGTLAVLGTGFTAGAAFTVGKLSCLLSYANQYAKPFNDISSVIAEFQNALACCARIFELTEQPEISPDADGSEAPAKILGNVELDKVCFSYYPGQDLIENLSLDVRRGERIAIVGPTGCGKTTVINLLMRFYDPDSGTISLENTDIRRIPRPALRGSYGMVLQDTWIKTGTVRQNIAFGRPGASEEEIRQAAASACLTGIIARLPDGYDTVISEGGPLLSQGEKQLLCIARAMLCKPPMLILDEATSNVDTRTEEKIQEAFGRLMQGRTCFIVAHRLSTVRSADLILVMKKGKVIERGRHAELLNAGGFYASLYNSQFEN